MLITKFVEVPNTNIREEVLPHQYEYDLLYSMAQEFGHAELVWYALNGKRVVEGEYTDRDYPPLSQVSLIRSLSAVGGLSDPPL